MLDCIMFHYIKLDDIKLFPYIMLDSSYVMLIYIMLDYIKIS